MLNEKTVKTLFAIVTPPILVKSIAHSQLIGPSNLQSNINRDRINLSWEILNPDAVLLFNVYRAILPIYENYGETHKIDFIRLQTTDKTSYTDNISSFSNNYMFIYYVTSIFKEGGESSPSNYVKVIQDGIRMNFIKESMTN